MKLNEAVGLAVNELTKAQERYSKFNSAHEGYAVILEEVDELWSEIKKNPYYRNMDAMAKEATQVAAMALRFLMDCC